MIKKDEMTLAAVVERLMTNDPTFITFSLESILINPEVRPLFLREVKTCSVITDEVLIKLARALKDNHILKTLVIEDGSFIIWECTDVGIREFGASLKMHRSLEKIKISSSFKFNDDQVVDFLKCFIQESKIKMLNLAMREGDFIERLGSVLKLNKSLKHIRIYTHTHGEVASDKQQLFFESLTENKILKSLAIEGVWFGNKGLEIFNDSLPEKTKLHSLELIACGINSSGAHFLATIIQKCVDLESLRIHYNNLGDGLKAIIDALIPLKRLRNLGLNAVGLAVEEINHLTSQWLKHHFAITSLDISSNSLDESCIRALLPLITKGETLKSLGLAFCQLSPDIILDIMKPILSDSKNCQLERLSLINNYSIKKIINIIIDILHSNENITNLSTGRRNQKIEKVLEYNRNKKIYLSKRQFVSSIIELGKIYFSSSRTALSSIPYELMHQIFIYIGQGTLSLKTADILSCSDQIFSNLEHRHHLITSGKYNPSIKSDSSKWWSAYRMFEDTKTQVFFPSKDKYYKVKDEEYDEKTDKKPTHCALM